jgi:hypothetical protein
MMVRSLSRLCLLVVALAPAGGALAADRQPRYVALLAGGQRIEGDRLSNWYDAGGVPHLAGQSLLAPTNPFRWLRDRTRRLADTPEAYIEFTNGDRLPGIVVDYRSGQDDAFLPEPPHFIVRVALAFEPPENKPVPEIRVLTQFVRRIVWRDRGRASAQPATVIFSDGRSLAFRALRFRAGEINVLLSSGGQRIAWDELAELNLAAVDPWSAWFDQAAAVCPTASTRLIEIETSTGLLATASLARLAARFEGNSADPDRWVHGLQPAWSLDILWVPFREIVYYRSYARTEVPLSRIAPRLVFHREGIGGSQPVQTNRNVLGGLLASKTLEFGWGLGVGGGTELTFDLPPGARSLRAAVCLDRSAGDGGCVRPRVFANAASGKALWEGPILVGSEKVLDTGAIALQDAAPATKTIVLQSDPVLTNKPAGADPLDIRDHVNWCDPLVGLDAAAVQSEFDKRLPQRSLAWSGWEVSFDKGSPEAAGLQTAFVRTAAIPGSFEPAVITQRLPLVLRREWTPTAEEHWLVIAASRVKAGLPDPRIAVRIAGRLAGELTIPDPGRGEDTRIFMVRIHTTNVARASSLPIEIRQAAEEKGIGVVYRSIAITDHPPALFRLFEDDAEPMPLAADATGEAKLVTDERYTGTRALSVTPDGQFRVKLPATIRVREQPRLGEARFIRFAVLKRGGGRVALELEDTRPRAAPARYDAGHGAPTYGAAVRIADEPPAEWIVVTRDLFADFGNIDVQALIAGCEGGEAALIDHVYLARTRVDLEAIDVGKKAQQP